MDFQKALSLFTGMLKTNNLPTDIRWVSWHNIRLTDLRTSRAYYSKIDENKQFTNQILAEHIAGGGDEYLQLNDAQKKLTRDLPEGPHLFINLDKPMPEGDIKKIYDRLVPKGNMVVFYAITVHENKTVCGLLYDWFGEDESDNAHNFQMLPDERAAFSVHEMWDQSEVTFIHDPKDWTEIQGLPMKLSNLDYLTIKRET